MFRHDGEERNKEWLATDRPVVARQSEFNSSVHRSNLRTVSPMAQATVARALCPPCGLAATTTPSRASPNVHQRFAGGAQWLVADRCRRRCTHRAAAGLFGGLFGGASGSEPDEQLEPLETDEGGLMVALDASSSGSLDGSSEEPFGPLVRWGCVESSVHRPLAGTSCGKPSATCL